LRRRSGQGAPASSTCRPARPTDLNPVEQAFAKLKTLLRKVAAPIRDDLWDTIGALLDTFSPSECRNYISATHYHPV